MIPQGRLNLNRDALNTVSKNNLLVIDFIRKHLSQKQDPAVNVYVSYFDLPDGSTIGLTTTIGKETELTLVTGGTHDVARPTGPVESHDAGGTQAAGPLSDGPQLQ